MGRTRQKKKTKLRNDQIANNIKKLNLAHVLTIEADNFYVYRYDRTMTKKRFYKYVCYKDSQLEFRHSDDTPWHINIVEFVIDVFLDKIRILDNKFVDESFSDKTIKKLDKQLYRILGIRKENFFIYRVGNIKQIYEYRCYFGYKLHFQKHSSKSNWHMEILDFIFSILIDKIIILDKEDIDILKLFGWKKAEEISNFFGMDNGQYITAIYEDKDELKCDCSFNRRITPMKISMDGYQYHVIYCDRCNHIISHRIGYI